MSTPSPSCTATAGPPGHTTTVQPGLLVLHSNRAEMLSEAIFAWMQRHPLDPLEEEIFLVQSNGVAEWLKMTLASQVGVCAATRVELPGRFLWRSYRQVLGRDAVPAESALDKRPLTWRLMHLLPQLVDQPGYEPLAGFLRGDDVDRRFQLAERLADLYDQYQVYRSDWLSTWAAGHDTLPPQPDADPARAPALPEGQRWQASLWRALLQPLQAQQQGATRAALHQRFVARLSESAPLPPKVARRVVLFGMTHVPQQTLQALAALAAHSQVVLAIPNPSRFHWADIMEGRELLRMERRRHPLRGGRDLAALPLEDMHAHGHPLLAAWGRQGRDFVRQLDAFDDAAATQQRFAGAKIDLFDEAEGGPLLAQVQAHIRDLLPLAEHPHTPVGEDDRSIVFHVAHSSQREVEILHDQLLALLADTHAGAAALKPRDIVVMVPDIESFAPAIRSVFGQHGRNDPRTIPYDIADLSERGTNPVLVALEWLLRMPQARCRLTEVRDLLDVPALASAFGLAADDLPQLTQWMEGAGIRWGLDASHRAALGLQACGEQNSWMFGMRRMLLGYALGDTALRREGEEALSAEPSDTIEPYAEVGGLSAERAGSLAELVSALMVWRDQAEQPAAPLVWAERFRQLLTTFFAAQDERERLSLAAIEAALQAWLSACDLAEFDAPVPLAVAREGWLDSVDEPGLKKRFRAGGVTFCTLMPMRAVPFEVVCLLGMNDGDYPRSTPRSDFDLMGLPGQRRPGDRSRRDDDRQLMLEAVLSARRVLYISWTGRSVQDNSEQPPSVLVAQLRDYLQAGWAPEIVAQRTTHHRLQPFSRGYFEQSVNAAAAHTLFTYAREWRAAHAGAMEGASPQAIAADTGSVAGTPGAQAADKSSRLDTRTLASFLKNPVKTFFQHQLDVRFTEDDAGMVSEEAFEVQGLDEYSLLTEVLGQVQASAGAHAQPLAQAMGQIARAGRLPLAEFGQRKAQDLSATLHPMLQSWHGLQAQFSQVHEPLPLRYRLEAEGNTPDQGESAALQVEDWLDGLRSAPGAGGVGMVWMEMSASRLCTAGKNAAPRPDKLLRAWVRTLLAAVCHPDLEVQGILVGKDAVVFVNPLPPDEAQEALQALLQGWQRSMLLHSAPADHMAAPTPKPVPAPLPVACLTALEWLQNNEGERDENAALVYEGDGHFNAGEVAEACLARMFPDFETLSADGQFAYWADQLYAPLLHWVQQCTSCQPHSAPDLADAGLDPTDSDRAGAAA